MHLIRTRTLRGLAAVLSAILLVSPAFATPGRGTLYGTDAIGGNLLTIDPTTGAATLVGFMDIGVVPALAVDPTTEIVYAATGAGSPSLFTVDPSTGSAMLVGDTGLGLASVGAMDFRADGTLYAAVNMVGTGGTGSDHLATIDKATGVATVIGPFGDCSDDPCTIEGIEAIAFDKAGTLWGAHSARGIAGPPGLYMIDPATGAATFVAPILDASGDPPSGGVVSLQFACDGALYGGTATAISPATDGGMLVTIDPATGLFSYVGTVGATGGTSLGALAFGLPCPDGPVDRDFMVIGLSGVDIGQSALVSGDIASNAAVTIGKNTRVSGEVFGDFVSLNQGASVDETVHANTVNLGKNARIGGQESPITLPIVGPLSVPPVSIPPGAEKVVVAKLGVRELQPGTFQSIETGQSAQLRFTGGQYIVSDMRIGKGTRLIFEGASTLNVVNRLELAQNVVLSGITGLTPGDILVNYAGSADAVLGKGV